MRPELRCNHLAEKTTQSNGERSPQSCTATFDFDSLLCQLSLHDSIDSFLSLFFSASVVIDIEM